MQKLALLLVLAAYSTSSLAMAITFSSGTGDSIADAGPGSEVSVEAIFSSPPFSSGPITATAGGSVSTTSYSFTETSLLIEFEHSRVGADTASRAYAQSKDGGGADALVFTLDEPMMATISGQYSVSDTGQGDDVNFFIRLFEINAGTVHETSVRSRSTANEFFTVGDAGGDFTNSIIGSTTNLLSTNNPYSLQWNAFIQDLASDAGDAGATASGFFRVDFTRVSVPEPSTLILLAAGIVGAGCRRRR
jgi:hypothetical protein